MKNANDFPKVIFPLVSFRTMKYHLGCKKNKNKNNWDNGDSDPKPCYKQKRVKADKPTMYFMYQNFLVFLGLVNNVPTKLSLEKECCGHFMVSLFTIGFWSRLVIKVFPSIYYIKSYFKQFVGAQIWNNALHDVNKQIIIMYSLIIEIKIFQILNNLLLT